jgi:hypothetical protein
MERHCPDCSTAGGCRLTPDIGSPREVLLSCKAFDVALRLARTGPYSHLSMFTNRRLQLLQTGLISSHCCECQSSTRCKMAELRHRTLTRRALQVAQPLRDFLNLIPAPEVNPRSVDIGSLLVIEFWV